MFPISTTLFPNPNNNSSNFSFLTEHHHHNAAVSTCNIDQLPYNYKITKNINKNSNKKKKKKRSLPGQPDPEAEVIALSPGTLLATNRFTCEICNRTFQREQNLQLHRRGHNLPWKLKRRGENKSSKKQVYVCPEVTCVHHHPSRALGDLTGIKKHFCRKHGEKKWNCHKCSKLYAVHSDWKAHSKTCGTRHYTCDCGSVFSRKDSFVTHKGFCDALAQESARLLASAGGERSSSQDLTMMMMINSTSSSSNYSPHHQNPNPNYNYTSSTAAPAPAPSSFGYSNVAAPFHHCSHDLGTHHAGVNYKDYNYSSVVMIPSTTNDDHNHVVVMRDEVEEFMHANFQGAADNHHHHLIMSRQDKESCLTRNFWV